MKKSAKITLAVKLYYLMKKTKLQYHHGENSTKLPYVIYVNAESLLRKKGDFFCSNCFNSFRSANKIN